MVIRPLTHSVLEMERSQRFQIGTWYAAPQQRDKELHQKVHSVRVVSSETGNPRLSRCGSGSRKTARCSGWPHSPATTAFRTRSTAKVRGSASAAPRRSCHRKSRGPTVAPSENRGNGNKDRFFFLSSGQKFLFFLLFGMKKTTRDKTLAAGQE